MSGGVTIWRIGVDTPDYVSEDLTGKGAEISGGRWNRAGTSMIYCASHRSLACLETLVHLSRRPLPLNRYLVEITVPVAAWHAAAEMDVAHRVGWDAEPAGMASLDWGTNWIRGARTLLARVPSIVVPEEFNVLINPGHPHIGRVAARKVRKFIYDARLSASA